MKKKGSVSNAKGKFQRLCIKCKKCEIITNQKLEFGTYLPQLRLETPDFIQVSNWSRDNLHQ